MELSATLSPDNTLLGVDEVVPAPPRFLTSKVGLRPDQVGLVRTIRLSTFRQAFELSRVKPERSPDHAVD